MKLEEVRFLFLERNSAVLLVNGLYLSEWHSWAFPLHVESVN